jgi:uncharacterized protein with ParB-like and HNH nuclease domain
MPDKYTSDRNTVGALLALTSPSIQVPEWQRSYSWDSPRVEIFWNDLLNFSHRYPDKNIADQEYFLGALVIVDAGGKQLLLDGQQRLATATILLSVIRDFLKEYKADAAGRVQQRYIADIDDATNAVNHKLTMNRYDKEFFQREIQEFPPVEPTPEPKLASHHAIRAARDFFKNMFETKYTELGRGEPAYRWALRIQDVLTNHVSLVAVRSTDEDNASSVFETLNDRGIGLSTPDLLRTLLMRRANTEAEREEIINLWETILGIEDEASVQNFLRHYWLSMYGDIKTHALYREIKQRIETNNIESLGFSRELGKAASLYHDIATATEADLDLRRSLLAVQMLGATSLLPAILSAYSIEDIEGRKKFLSALVATFVRHNVIGTLEMSKLENISFEIARQLRTDKTFDPSIAKLVAFAPTDDQFTTKFKTARVGRRSSARYVLRELEHAIRRTKELAVEETDRVHVEHVYPQNPPVADKWKDHDLWIDRLGNLTLLARRLNEKIRNEKFSAKKPEYQKSDLELTKQLLKYGDWNSANVNERQEWMAGFVKDIWKIG